MVIVGSRGLGKLQGYVAGESSFVCVQRSVANDVCGPFTVSSWDQPRTTSCRRAVCQSWSVKLVQFSGISSNAKAVVDSSRRRSLVVD